MLMNAVRSASKRRCLGTAEAHNLLKPFQTFGWQPNESLNADENFIDLTLILTRSSKLKQGSMACILVRQASDNNAEGLVERILIASTNKPLYRAGDSDIHAEISALGLAAKSGLATEDCTAYITMPPCKTCFGALFSAGIKRIVSLRSPAVWLQEVAAKNGIEMKGSDDVIKHRERVDEIVRRYMESDASSEDSSDAMSPLASKIEDA